MSNLTHILHLGLLLYSLVWLRHFWIVAKRWRLWQDTRRALSETFAWEAQAVFLRRRKRERIGIAVEFCQLVAMTISEDMIARCVRMLAVFGSDVEPVVVGLFRSLQQSLQSHEWFLGWWCALVAVYIAAGCLAALRALKIRLPRLLQRHTSEHSGTILLEWGLIPVLEACFQMLACDSQRLQDDEEIVCFSGKHAFLYLPISLCLLVTLIPLGLRHAAAKGDQSPELYYLPRFEVVDCFARIAVSALYALLAQPRPRTFLVLTIAVIVSLLAACYYLQPCLGKARNYEFNHARTARYAGVCWAALVALLQEGNRPGVFEAGLLALCVGLPAVMCVGWRLSQRRGARMPASHWATSASRGGSAVGPPQRSGQRGSHGGVRVSAGLSGKTESPAVRRSVVLDVLSRWSAGDGRRPRKSSGAAGQGPWARLR